MGQAVSIPFKRERLSELRKKLLFLRLWIFCFNSLQTGKAFRTLAEGASVYWSFVSIPFKRERLSEHIQILVVVEREKVSIPFKRERLSELVGLYYVLNLEFWRFNSLQTGKAFRTKKTDTAERRCGKRFQFPSNGKGFPNYNFEKAAVYHL